MRILKNKSKIKGFQIENFYFSLLGDRHFFILLIILFSIACNSSVKVSPPITGLIGSEVYNNNTTAAATVTSIYDRMSNAGLSDGFSSISLQIGLSADELTNYNANDALLPGIYSNSLLSINSYFWPELYLEIYVANAAIEGLSGSTTVNASLKKQLI